jgi:hypothetical protein
MNRNRESTNAVEPLQQVEQQAAPRHFAVRVRRTVEIEKPEQRRFILSALSSPLFASRESFITDWADS